MSEQEAGMNYFLVIFDRFERRLVKITPFQLESEAVQALFDAEDHYLSRSARQYEVVLLGAEHLSDLHKTHGRYFANPGGEHGHLIAI